MRRDDCPRFHVKKRTLLAIAGCVWFAAGFNVARLGVLAYLGLDSVTPLRIVLSVVVFAVFGAMFLKMGDKHTSRIHGYEQETKPVWHFFDLRSYCIMFCMMTGGIWLRSSGLVPEQFIAVFYTGLGCALASAGVFFWSRYLVYPAKTQLAG